MKTEYEKSLLWSKIQNRGHNLVRIAKDQNPQKNLEIRKCLSEIKDILTQLEV